MKNTERFIYLACIMFLVARWGAKTHPDATFLIYGTYALAWTCTLMAVVGFFGTLIHGEKMIAYPGGMKRLVRGFIIRKRINDEVRYLQFCNWEEEYRELCNSDGRWREFIPTHFVTQYTFDKLFHGTPAADAKHSHSTTI